MDPEGGVSGAAPTLLMTGTNLQTTRTSAGGRPISSSASRSAVYTSSASLGSLFPPGKHTSPALVRSCTDTQVGRSEAVRIIKRPRPGPARRPIGSNLRTSRERSVIRVNSRPFFTVRGISTEALGSTGRDEASSFPTSSCFKMAIVSSLTRIAATPLQREREFRCFLKPRPNKNKLALSQVQDVRRRARLRNIMGTTQRCTT